MGTRASWSTPACWPGGVRARLGRAGEHAHPPPLLVPTLGSCVPMARAKRHQTCQTALPPGPGQSPYWRLPRQRVGLTVVLRVAPASHGTNLAIHQGLAGSWEAHGLDVFCERDHLVQPYLEPASVQLPPVPLAHPFLCPLKQLQQQLLSPESSRGIRHLPGSVSFISISPGRRRTLTPFHRRGDGAKALIQSLTMNGKARI